MELSRKAGKITWDQLKLTEQMLMLAMLVRPQKDTDWSVLRMLCFYRVAEITPQGLALTRLGRFVIAERHGLPVVVGRDIARGARFGGSY